jgi:hypothetical protein
MCRGLVGTVVDPDSIGTLDPNPDSQSGSGSRRAKMTYKSRIKLKKFHVFKCWMFAFEGSRLLYCSLDISKLRFLKNKNKNKNKYLFQMYFFQSINQDQKHRFCTILDNGVEDLTK